MLTILEAGLDEMNNLAASRRGITFAILSFFSQQAAGNRACELNGVNINPHCGI